MEIPTGIPGREEIQGTGIGLAIVWNIIHGHGGTIRMESAIDQRCTCFFTIGGED
jgi:signal transduction histidine kinase